MPRTFGGHARGERVDARARWHYDGEKRDTANEVITVLLRTTANFPIADFSRTLGSVSSTTAVRSFFDEAMRMEGRDCRGLRIVAVRNELHGGQKGKLMVVMLNTDLFNPMVSC